MIVVAFVLRVVITSFLIVPAVVQKMDVTRLRPVETSLHTANQTQVGATVKSKKS